MGLVIGKKNKKKLLKFNVTFMNTLRFWENIEERDAISTIDFDENKFKLENGEKIKIIAQCDDSYRVKKENGMIGM